MGNYENGRPGLPLQDVIYQSVGLKVGGGRFGEIPDNVPFRPLVCSWPECENRHDEDGAVDGWSFYVLRQQGAEWRYGAISCAEHLQSNIEVMIPSIFGSDNLIIRPAKPGDWKLSPRVERLTEEVR